MLDKSPEQILDNDLSHIQNEFEKTNPSIVLCSEPFHKAQFLDRLINSTTNPIIFVDLDLLYTGYVESGMIEKRNNVSIFHPNKDSWKDELTKVISQVSEKKFLVIIDSFNGVYNLFDDLESALFINSCIMLLSSLGEKTNSSIVIAGMARKNEKDEWKLSPGGKQIIKSDKTGVYFLKKSYDDLLIFPSADLKSKSKSFRIK